MIRKDRVFLLVNSYSLKSGILGMVLGMGVVVILRRVRRIGVIWRTWFFFSLPSDKKNISLSNSTIKKMDMDGCTDGSRGKGSNGELSMIKR